jgi:cysteine desulfurase / selenocysteine lyase
MITTARSAESQRDKVERIISDFPILRERTSRGKRLVYLDSAATSQKPQIVIDALVDYYSHYNANIHRGVYEIAERATDAFETARGVHQRTARRNHLDQKYNGGH